MQANIVQYIHIRNVRQILDLFLDAEYQCINQIP